MNREAGLWPIIAGTSDDEGALWLRWLVRLRWVAIAAQILALAFSFSLLQNVWLLVPLGIVIVLLVVGNLRALQILAIDEGPGAGEATPVAEDVLLAQLGIDVVALTGFFVLAGGPENPFTILYVIHVAMAAIMLPPRRSAALTALVLGCYGLIHVVHVPLRFDHHALTQSTLIGLGRVLSFTVASVSVGIFAVGLATSLRRRSAQLLEARDRTARTDRLRSVGTLAAGAAHELNTPLSTIDLRLRRIARRHADPDTAKDLEVMQGQLDRCVRVVEQLLIGAGDPSASGLERSGLGVLVSESVGLWSKGSAVGVEFRDASDGIEVEVPRVAFIQGLINLLENAREAQEDVACLDPIDVDVIRDGSSAIVRIRDRGVGLPPEGADRVGDPFFTTKPSGTGLGVFVARAVAEGAGGGLGYAPAVGGGTEARWWFPESSRRHHDPERTASEPRSPTADRG
jgi:two-component system sensor histidine kinase RegB